MLSSDLHTSLPVTMTCVEGSISLQLFHRPVPLLSFSPDQNSEFMWSEYCAVYSVNIPESSSRRDMYCSHSLQNECIVYYVWKAVDTGKWERWFSIHLNSAGLLSRTREEVRGCVWSSGPVLGGGQSSTEQCILVWVSPSDSAPPWMMSNIIAGIAVWTPQPQYHTFISLLTATLVTLPRPIILFSSSRSLSPSLLPHIVYTQCNREDLTQKRQVIVCTTAQKSTLYLLPTLFYTECT